MQDEIFARRLKNWKSEGELTAFNLACVAEGKIDCYFARQQPFVDVFSGIYIARQAGAVVTDFDGNPVEFVAEEQTVWDVLATTNQALHQQVLSAIADCRKQKTEERI
jgi:fructose-1,6-bisphosphatase/inositol monophosphatase family enzyme